MDLSGPLRPQSALLGYSKWHLVPLGHLAWMRLMGSSAKEDYLKIAIVIYRTPGVPFWRGISVSLRFIHHRVFALRNKASIKSDISRIDYPISCPSKSSQTCIITTSYIYTSIACSPYGIDRDVTTTIYETCLDRAQWLSMSTLRSSDTTVW